MTCYRVETKAGFTFKGTQRIQRDFSLELRFSSDRAPPTHVSHKKQNDPPLSLCLVLRQKKPLEAMKQQLVESCGHSGFPDHSYYNCCHCSYYMGLQHIFFLIEGSIFTICFQQCKTQRLAHLGHSAYVFVIEFCSIHSRNACDSS